MRREKEFDLVDFVRLLEAKDISYLLIGRWAVILHGAPLMTADYDFWISPDMKMDFLEFLEEEDYELPPRSRWRKPIVNVYCGVEKIDLFFFRQIVNRENQRLTFLDCRKRSEVKKDPKTGFSVRLPSLEDLIVLKKIPRKRQEDILKDATDIRFLEACKKQRTRKSRRS